MLSCRTLISAALLTLSLNLSADIQSFQGVWKNQRGSILELGNVNAVQDIEQNVMKGVFRAAVTITPECIHFPLPVLATINDNALAIMINFQPCGSPTVVSISGYMTEDGQLETQWVARKKGEDNISSWFFNRDIYTRIDTTD